MSVTIHDVAHQAHVSASTVSRAFTTPEMVRTSTRERILRVADEVGYRPNRAARGLITGKTANIGLIVPDLGNPLFPAILKGAQARALLADHAVFLADTDEDPELEVSLIQAMAKQVDGIVLCSSRMSEKQLRGVLDLTDLTFLNRKVAGVPIVLIDSADGMRQAVEHLAALGHKKVAYLSGPPTSWSNRERRRGLRAASRTTGVEAIELGPFAPKFEAGQQAADLVLATDVTAVLAFNDLIALGVLNRLADRGVGVPAEMSVIGFDDIAFAAMCTPPLTTVFIPKESAGRAAVELLLDWLDKKSLGHTSGTQRTLGTQLIVRSSTAPPKVRAASDGHATKSARQPKGD
ncbi:MAG: LacI family transcriptional regulator [Pseudonocardiales bacterium]|nr:MAG: LacI family transcriptional regulator [Pseudonocardiales bacterium]